MQHNNVNVYRYIIYLHSSVGIHGLGTLDILCIIYYIYIRPNLSYTHTERTFHTSIERRHNGSKINKRFSEKIDPQSETNNYKEGFYFFTNIPMDLKLKTKRAFKF